MHIKHCTIASKGSHYAWLHLSLSLNYTTSWLSNRMSALVVLTSAKAFLAAHCYAAPIIRTMFGHQCRQICLTYTLWLLQSAWNKYQDISSITVSPCSTIRNLYRKLRKEKTYLSVSALFCIDWWSSCCHTPQHLKSACIIITSSFSDFWSPVWMLSGMSR